MTVRVLVIGTGFGARVVAPVFAATEGCVVVGVVSARDDVSAAIRSTPSDIVSIHSPPFLHAENARVASESGRAILCDKPTSPTAEETVRMLAHANSAGVLHLVNFEFRYDPVRRIVREHLRSGLIGRLERVEWIHHSSGARTPMRRFGWLFDAALGGGWIGAWASHAVDTMHWMLDERLDVVESHPRIDVAFRVDRDQVARECTAEDGVIATLRSESGVSITFDSTFVALHNKPPRLAFVGTAGSITVTGDRIDIMVEGREQASSPVDALERSSDRELLTPDHRVDPHADPHVDSHLEPMRRWAEVVRDCVIAGVPIGDAPTLVDGLAVDRVLDVLRTG